VVRDKKKHSRRRQQHVVWQHFCFKSYMGVTAIGGVYHNIRTFHGGDDDKIMINHNKP
jgi:hypothetical protein